MRARTRPVRVAQIVTKFTAGAGGVTLRGALALDPDRYSTTVFTAEGGSYADSAEEAGLSVVVVPHLAKGRGVYPWVDVQAFRELSSQLRRGEFDLVHTNSAKAGAIGRRPLVPSALARSFTPSTDSLSTRSSRYRYARASRGSSEGWGG